jgi:hypothetical protein
VAVAEVGMRATIAKATFLALGVALLGCPAPSGAGTAAPDDLPIYLRDRGTGIATSLSGTYVRNGELLVYPFYEYTVNNDQEYKPSELGFAGEHDYRGKYTEHEALIFFSYGVSDNVMLELESALYSSATLRKAPEDTSAVPARLKESGFGDTQAEIRWRWWKENERRPEFWSYFEVVFPFQRDRVLIGTQDWEVVQGFGLTRGFRWGTLTGRVSVSYTAEDKSVIFGEYAIEYLRRISPKWRWVLAMEGEQDERALIGEAQYELSHRALLKLNNAIGISSKAPDVAPEVGIVFSL